LKVIVFLIIFLFLDAAAILYLDSKYAADVYEFCTSQPDRADSTAVEKAANTAGLVSYKDSPERLLVQKALPFPYFHINTCEFNLKNDKVVNRSFLQL